MLSLVIVNLTKPLFEPLVHLRCLLDLTKSLSMSFVIEPKVSTVFGDEIAGVAISTAINLLYLL